MAHRIVTAGEPSKIRLTVDRDIIKAEPSDVVHVTVEILDKSGYVVPTAENLVRFEVEGAQIIGVENGNMRDLSSTRASEKKAYAGMCLAIIQADKAGSIKIKAASEGLEAGEINIKAVK